MSAGRPTTSACTEPASNASITPVVGDLDLTYEAMELPANPGWTMFAYTAETDSATEERLKLLASWAATTAEIPVATSHAD